MDTNGFEYISTEEIAYLLNEFDGWPILSCIPDANTRERYLLEFAMWYCRKLIDKHDGLK